eukprot:3949160-Lingulodinium_polyedra.AAC.1
MPLAQMTGTGLGSSGLWARGCLAIGAAAWCGCGPGPRSLRGFRCLPSRAFRAPRARRLGRRGACKQVAGRHVRIH